MNSGRRLLLFSHEPCRYVVSLPRTALSSSAAVPPDASAALVDCSDAAAWSSSEQPQSWRSDGGAGLPVHLHPARVSASGHLAATRGPASSSEGSIHLQSSTGSLRRSPRASVVAARNPTPLGSLASSVARPRMRSTSLSALPTSVLQAPTSMPLAYASLLAHLEAGSC